MAPLRVPEWGETEQESRCSQVTCPDLPGDRPGRLVTVDPSMGPTLAVRISVDAL